MRRNFEPRSNPTPYLQLVVKMKFAELVVVAERGTEVERDNSTQLMGEIDDFPKGHKSSLDYYRLARKGEDTEKMPVPV